MNKKIVELVIGENGLENLGVDAIALVESPAIEENFLYFKEEKFVEPKAGESEGDFIGRCMSAIEGEFPDQDQRLAVCYSYWQGSEEEFLRENPCLPGYVAYGTKMKDGREVPNCVPDESAKKFQDEMNLDVLGYATKNFEICPGAINTFKRLVELGAGDEDLEGMIRSAALQADAVFGIEKAVLADGTASKEDLYQATVIVVDFMDLIREIGEQIGEEFPVDYMMGHIEVIGNLIPDEEFAIDTSGLSPYVDQITEDDEEEELLKVLKTYSEEAFRAVTGFLTQGFTRQQVEANIANRNFKNGSKFYEYARISNASGDTRAFCDSIEGRFFRRSGINALKPYNTEFGHNRQEYSIWNYKGGPNCVHAWKEYVVENMELVEVGLVDGLPGTAPRNMANNGYYSPETKRRSEIAYAISQQNMSSSDSKSTPNSYYFNEDQRIATGPAMIPNYEMVRRADDGSKYYVYFSEETIKDIAEKFMREKRLNSTNIEHDSEDPRTNNYIYESWIVEDPEMDKAKAMGFNVPKGTWMVSMRVGDEQTWKLIKQGKIKGFSVEGFFGEMVKK